MPKHSYPVGYGKPPRKSQFKPGASGNPKGRPRGVLNLSTDLAQELSQKILITESGKPQKVTKQRAMLKALVAKSLKGDSRAAGTLLNLIPAVEHAQKVVQDSDSLNQSDKELLQAFREQMVQELQSTKVRRKKS